MAEHTPMMSRQTGGVHYPGCASRGLRSTLRRAC